MSELRDADPFEVRRALRPPAELRAFNEAGVLAAADVHVAARLMALAGEDDPDVALAAALAVRAPRLGHVYADLATVRDTTVVDVEEPVDIAALPWPEVAGWVARLAASELVGGPLRLEGTRVYLDRYWREERQIADDLRAFGGGARAGGAPAGAGGPAVREDVLRDGLARLFGPDDERQRAAAEAAVRRRLAVVAGGPGTGKTTTVARIAALLDEQAQAAGVPAPLIALAAPTGKAAARLEEAVHDEARGLDVSEATRAALLGLEASTLHRLLGRRRGSHSRFRHHRGNRLPHDVVVVDETSMVSLSLMARLVEAVRPEARLVLVGDPGQLSSIEAGAVLGDIVGPATGEGIVVLDRVHRFGGGIASLAGAVRDGDADRALEVLRAAPEGVTWIEHDAADGDGLGLVRRRAVDAGRAVFHAAREGDAEGALAALGAFRLLCAHRRGPYGVAAWGPQVEGWLTADVGGFSADDRWYAGRPAARDGERLRAAPLQRRHRRRGGGRRPRDRRVRAPRGGDARRPEPARVRRHGARDDDPQGAGLAVRHRRRPAARPRLAPAHARAALHRDHARPGGADPGRHRGRRPRRGRAPGRPRLRPARAAVGHVGR